MIAKSTSPALPARRLGHRLAAEFAAALLAVDAHEKNAATG
jgi:hypothetical protein